jgi:hypothetical protein
VARGQALLTRPSTTTGATATAAVRATEHNPLAARRSTAARSANDKLACSCGHTDGLAARSAVIMNVPGCCGWLTLRIWGLHGEAATGTWTRCEAIAGRRPKVLTTALRCDNERYER